MNRAAAILFIFLAPSGVALASDPIAAYRYAIEYCAGENIARFDDGVSPANVVGEGLLTLCRRKHRTQYVDALAARSAAWMSGYERGATKQFTTYVLLHRANKKSGQ